MSTQLDPSVFKAYDVRGIYGEQIDEDIAYRIGRAFVRVLAKDYGDGLNIGLGHDMRLSAPAMAEQYARGIRDEGATVHDVGQVGTEQLYFTVGKRELDGGLMCTASHNPKAYTGAKVVRRGAIPLSGETGIEEIGRITADDPGPPVDNPGEIVKEDIAADFEAAALNFIDPNAVKPTKVV